jgi:preprotein translocase subunit YajC
MGPVIVIVVLIGLVWFLLAVPARRRQRSHQAMQDSVVVDDEIISAGGMHGFVREADDAQLRVEIAPGVIVTLDRRAVAAVAVEEPLDEDEDEDNGEQLGSRGEASGGGGEPDGDVPAESTRERDEEPEGRRAGDESKQT